MVLLTNTDTKLTTDHGLRQKRSQERQYIFDTVSDVKFIWKTMKTKTKTNLYCQIIPSICFESTTGKAELCKTEFNLGSLSYNFFDCEATTAARKARKVIRKTFLHCCAALTSTSATVTKLSSECSVKTSRQMIKRRK